MQPARSSERVPYGANSATLTVNTATHPWIDPGRFGGYGQPTGPQSWPPGQIFPQSPPPSPPADPFRDAMARAVTRHLLPQSLPLSGTHEQGAGLTLDQLRQAFRQVQLAQQAGLIAPPAPHTPGSRLPPLNSPQTLTTGKSLLHTPGTQFHQERTPVPEITPKPSQTVKALLTGLRKRRPIHLTGVPGIGKSQLVAQAAGMYYVEQMGGTIDAFGRVHDADGRFVPKSRYLIDVRAVLLDPVDLRGLPTIVDGRTAWAPPVFFPQAADWPITFFLDELNRAPQLVQNACLELALDRKVGEYALPDNVRVIAAGNRESDGGGVTRMNPALSTRFLNVNVEPDLDDFFKWALQTGVNPMIIAFLRFRPNLLCDFDRNARTWPNPRSWSFVSEILSDEPEPDIERILVAGAVGEGAAVEYLSFAQMYRNLPSIDDILARPNQAPVPTDVATRYAAASALAARAEAANFDRVLTYLKRLPREFMVFSVRDATTRDPDLTETPAFAAFAVENADLL